MVVPVIHDVFTITHQVSINYITLNPVVRVGLREDEVSFIPGSLINLELMDNSSERRHILITWKGFYGSR